MSTVKSNKSGKCKNLKGKLKNELSAWMWLLPLVLVLYLMTWRPTIMGGIWSFFKMKGYTAEEFIGFRNYYEVIKDTEFLPTLFNTVKYVVFSLVVGFIPPLMIAIMINETVHFKNGFKTILYLPAIVPGVVATLLWYYMYFPDATGLLNSILVMLGFEPYGWLNDTRLNILYIIIAMTWSGMPGTMLYYFTALQSVNVELYEAALIDGAGMLKRMMNVTIPQISGPLLLNFVLQIITVFQVMQEPMVMTGGGPDSSSTSLGYQIYKYGFVNGRAGHAMALSMIVFAILIVCTLFYFKIEKKVSENY